MRGTLVDPLARMITERLNDYGEGDAEQDGILGARQLRADPDVLAAMAEALHHVNCAYHGYIGESDQVAHNAEALAILDALFGPLEVTRS